VVTGERIEPFDQRHGARDHQDAAHRAQQAAFGEPSGEPRTEQRARDRGGRADAEQPPIDATGRVTDHPRHPHPEADREVGPDRARRRFAEPADHRGHAEAAEDQAHQAAEEADAQADPDRGAAATLAWWPGGLWLRPQEVDPEVEERDADHDQQRVARQLPGHDPAYDRADH